MDGNCFFLKLFPCLTTTLCSKKHERQTANNKVRKTSSNKGSKKVSNLVLSKLSKEVWTQTEDPIIEPVFHLNSPVDLPNILILYAQSEDEGSPTETQEMMLSMLSFMQASFAAVSRSAVRHVFTGPDMITEVEDFSRSLRQDERPFVMFYGHGAATGELCFGGDYLCPQEALSTINSAFVKNRPEGVDKWPLRCLFLHCYGHFLDEAVDPRPGRVIRYSNDMEFAYLTNRENPLCIGKVYRLTPNTAMLYHVERIVDINVSLHSTTYVRPSIVKDIKSFQAKIVNECVNVRPELAHESVGPRVLKKYLFRRQNYRLYLPEAIHQDATQFRNSLTKTLIVEVFPESGVKPGWSNLDDEVRRHCLHEDVEVIFQEASAISELLDIIRSFLHKHRTLPMPVVLILCGISWIGNEPFLSSVRDDPVALKNITTVVYVEALKVKYRWCKLVFSCKSQSGAQLYTNALHTFAMRAHIRELQNYLKELVAV